jgi:hypothetical protein
MKPKSKKLRRSKKPMRKRSRSSSRKHDGSLTSAEAMQLAEQLSEFMKNNMEGDEDDENHINNKLMKIILPHEIYYNITGSRLAINSEGADPDDSKIDHLRYWTDRYHYYRDIPIGDDDAYSY